MREHLVRIFSKIIDMTGGSLTGLEQRLGRHTLVGPQDLKTDHFTMGQCPPDTSITSLVNGFAPECFDILQLEAARIQTRVSREAGQSFEYDSSIRTIECGGVQKLEEV